MLFFAPKASIAKAEEMPKGEKATLPLLVPHCLLSPEKTFPEDLEGKVSIAVDQYLDCYLGTSWVRLILVIVTIILVRIARNLWVRIVSGGSSNKKTTRKRWFSFSSSKKKQKRKKNAFVHLAHYFDLIHLRDNSIKFQYVIGIHQCHIQYLQFLATVLYQFPPVDATISQHKPLYLN